jgi:hypothetical protein
MQNNTVSKYTISFGLSLALSSLVNASLVIVKEKSPAVQAEMQRLTGSHWITHVAVVLILFILFGFLFAKVAMSVNRLIKMIIAGIVAAGLMIVGFYLIAG